MKNIIDEEVEQFAYEHTKQESELFRRLRDETYAKMSSPHMQVGRIEGKFLQMLVRLSSAKHILEIGTFTGYSALMMAEGLPKDGRLITCEIDPRAEEIAKRYFAESIYGSKIEIRMGPALETLQTLTGPIDLAFIDADKANYVNYYEACMNLLRPGGLIIVDNMLWSGEVLNPVDNAAKAIVALNEQIQADSRVENVCLTVRDGIMLVRKR